MRNGITTSARAGLTGSSALGAECLINASTTGTSGQDSLDTNLWPNNPMQITAQSGGQKGNFVTTSSSIVTIPIIDNAPAGRFPPSGGNVTIVGYMQAFINEVHRRRESTSPRAILTSPCLTSLAAAQPQRTWARIPSLVAPALRPFPFA